MPILLIVLLFGTLGFLYWRRRMTTLTRACRWRQDREAKVWRCTFCGGEVPDSGRTPRVCLNPEAPRRR